MNNSLRGAAGALSANHPEIWKAYSQLGEACAQAGPTHGSQEAARRAYASVPALTYGSLCGQEFAKSQRQQEHDQVIVSSVAFGPIILFRTLPQLGTK